MSDDSEEPFLYPPMFDSKLKAMTKPTKVIVSQGGLFRCCIQSIVEYTDEQLLDMDRVECKHCNTIILAEIIKGDDGMPVKRFKWNGIHEA